MHSSIRFGPHKIITNNFLRSWAEPQKPHGDSVFFMNNFEKFFFNFEFNNLFKKQI